MAHLGTLILPVSTATANREWLYAIQDECWIEDNTTHQWLVGTRPTQSVFDEMGDALRRSSWRALRLAPR